VRRQNLSAAALAKADVGALIAGSDNPPGDTDG